jgi:hypothetical protein
MDGYRDTAFYLALWYAVLAALGAILLIALNDVELATAFLIAANAALLFALILIALAGRHITRGQFWRTLPPQARLPGEAGLRMARRALDETWLRFAKGAAALAILFAVFAYCSNGVSASAWATAVRKPATTQTEQVKAAWTSYRSARVLPTN